jgi:hypothetical protein
MRTLIAVFMVVTLVLPARAQTPVSFTDDVVPILTKFGCNTGGCHGKAEGQNGFKLSLFGFEPADDYEYIAKEALGRRLSTSAPESSLLLLKATGQVAHGGGVRLPLGSPEYRAIVNWIDQGARPAGPGDSRVVRIEVMPRETIFEGKTDRQPLRVFAHYDGGAKKDVTHLAQFESNQLRIAEVSDAGVVSKNTDSGSAAIMVRYQTFVDVFRATVPFGGQVTKLPPEKNFIDTLVFKQLKALGLPPSEVCDDATFLRRVTIDITGRLPTKAEAEAFLADKNPDRHEKLVDRLLASAEYADYFALKWASILRNRRNSSSDNLAPTKAFHGWIRDSLAQNKPFDRFVGEILTATGAEVTTPPVVWFRELREPSAIMEDTAQLFLGQRLQCAKCHHHPFEKWTQGDYWALTAFFSRTEVRLPTPAKKGKKGEPITEAVRFAEVKQAAGSAKVLHPRTRELLPPTPLGGKAIADDADPRQALADWLRDKGNPFFARTLVNRYWKHFFRRGLVDPEDDMRLTNPSVNDALLDALTKHFVEHRFDLKDLVRTICTSQVYRLSSVPNKDNARDNQYFSRFYPRRLNAEVLLDSLDDLTLAKTVFKGMPDGTRAVQLPDNQVESYFLSVFGRPDAASPCECERGSDASLAQALHLFNSEELMEKISGKSPDTKKESKGKKNAPAAPGLAVKNGGARLSQLISDKRPHEQKLRDLYLIAFAREPRAEERAALLAEIERRPDDLPGAYAAILWAIVNTKEFQYNH